MQNIYYHTTSKVQAKALQSKWLNSLVATDPATGKATNLQMILCNFIANVQFVGDMLFMRTRFWHKKRWRWGDGGRGVIDVYAFIAIVECVGKM